MRIVGGDSKRKFLLRHTQPSQFNINSKSLNKIKFITLFTVARFLTSYQNGIKQEFFD